MDRAPNDREERYKSHALVEIRPYRFIPFIAKSGVLLDLSFSGFKMDFTSAASIKPGSRFWLNVPLTSLGIYAPKKLMVQAECRWYDANKFRLGGVFVDLSPTERLVIDQVISTLDEMKKR